MVPERRSANGNGTTRSAFDLATNEWLERLAPSQAGG
jgi:hypothetical protein